MDNIFEQAFILMVAGMGAVYLFLLVLLCVMKGAALVVPKLSFMLPDPAPAAPKKTVSKDNGAAIAVAIAAALKRRGK